MFNAIDVSINNINNSCLLVFNFIIFKIKLVVNNIFLNKTY